LTSVGEQAAGQQPVTEQAPGQRAASPPVNGQPPNGQPANGQPANGQPANGQPASPQTTPPAPPAAGGPSRAAGSPTLRTVGISLLLLSVFLLGFAGYLFGLSATIESRSQTTMYQSLRYNLGQATAPTGPVNPGTPVAILRIPNAGVKNMVVVEGTSPENLMLGPGLVRSSPMPGQAGVSEIYGRLATFGAPFSHLSQLKVGDEIIAITAQGKAVYKVAAFGDSSHLVVDPAPNRLLLLTAGSPYVPTYYDYVDADLVTAVQPEPGGLPAIFTDETALAGDNNALVIALLWAIALAGVSGLATFAASRWAPWPVYLAASPVVLVVIWNLYHTLAALLPNVY
jgi:sortase A